MHTLNIIVAVSSNGGIGLKGRLPWRLKKDMAFFKKITTDARPGLKNAVIMGRNTWDSIPDKAKPLPDRINVIISSQLCLPPSGTYLVRSFTECMNLLNGDLRTQVDKVFIIGGSQLYREILQQTLYPVRIFCTHVENHVECDTFFPEVIWDKLKQLRLPEVPSESVEENGYSYRFVVYEYGTQ
ncbi:dihydrofolate reductase [Paragonimus westermani]|uniref:dihydrofolate reductase n=1 Tax=Paragonimus westermani TaxID=34504 RepID=A0A5J4N5Y0_9TREM|nr:dihydrofolate reductase [Paragonimus westermani]